jgi:hypothetical protein
MDIKVLFDSLSTLEKFNFVKWLVKSRENYVSFAQLNEGERKVFAHFWHNLAKELGYNIDRSSIDRQEIK